jgi:sugar phosphate isomerase/epimerase
MPIYGRTQPLARYSIRECLDVLKRLGFDGVELCLENPDIAPALLTHDLVKEVRDTLDELRLPRSVSYHKNYIDDDQLLEESKQAIRLTPLLGAQVFVFSGTRLRDNVGLWQRMVERTRELVRIAEDNGVILAKEFEPNFICGCTDDLHRLFTEIPSEALQANLDLGHVFLCDPDPMAAIAGLKGKVAHGHIENMAAGVHCHLPPWTGDMDLSAYFGALRAIGFDGPLALDLYKEDYEEISPQSLQYLRGLNQ